MKAFVTGGTGLVGSFLLVELLQSNYEIVAMHRNQSNFDTCRRIIAYHFENADEQFAKIIWIEADLLDSDTFENYIDTETVVFHCAAMVSFRKEDKEIVLQNNIEGTKNIVQSCIDKKAKKLVHVSSIAALGRGLEGKETSEEDYWDGSGKKASVYSVSKFESEREVWRGIAEGLTAVIVNPSVILGPGEWGKGSSQLITTVWKGLKFYTSGTNGYVDVRDVAKMMWMLAHSDIQSERYILSSENINYKTLFGWIAHYLGVKPPPFHAGIFLSGLSWRVLKILSLFSGKNPIITKETARSANQPYRYTNQKIKKALGVEFIPVEKSIQFCCEKFLEQHR